MRTIINLLLVISLTICISSCGLFSKAKYGCPSDGKNVGAERVLSGEKLPKAKKFRA